MVAKSRNRSSIDWNGFDRGWSDAGPDLHDLDDESWGTQSTHEGMQAINTEPVPRSSSSGEKSAPTPKAQRMRSDDTRKTVSNGISSTGKGHHQHGNKNSNDAVLPPIPSKASSVGKNAVNDADGNMRYATKRAVQKMFSVPRVFHVASDSIGGNSSKGHTDALIAVRDSYDGEPDDYSLRTSQDINRFMPTSDRMQSDAMMPSTRQTDAGVINVDSIMDTSVNISRVDGDTISSDPDTVATPHSDNRAFLTQPEDTEENVYGTEDNNGSSYVSGTNTAYSHSGSNESSPSSDDGFAGTVSSDDNVFIVPDSIGDNVNDGNVDLVMRQNVPLDQFLSESSMATDAPDYASSEVEDDIDTFHTNDDAYGVEDVTGVSFTDDGTHGDYSVSDGTIDSSESKEYRQDDVERAPVSTDVGYERHEMKNQSSNEEKGMSIRRTPRIGMTVSNVASDDSGIDFESAIGVASFNKDALIKSLQVVPDTTTDSDDDPNGWSSFLDDDDDGKGLDANGINALIGTTEDDRTDSGYAMPVPSIIKRRSGVASSVIPRVPSVSMPPANTSNTPATGTASPIQRTTPTGTSNVIPGRSTQASGHNAGIASMMRFRKHTTGNPMANGTSPIVRNDRIASPMPAASPFPSQRDANVVVDAMEPVASAYDSMPMMTAGSTAMPGGSPIIRNSRRTSNSSMPNPFTTGMPPAPSSMAGPSPFSIPEDGISTPSAGQVSTGTQMNPTGIPYGIVNHADNNAGMSPIGNGTQPMNPFSPSAPATGGMPIAMPDSAPSPSSSNPFGAQSQSSNAEITDSDDVEMAFADDAEDDTASPMSGFEGIEGTGEPGDSIYLGDDYGEDEDEDETTDTSDEDTDTDENTEVSDDVNDSNPDEDDEESDDEEEDTDGSDGNDASDEDKKHSRKDKRKNKGSRKNGPSLWDRLKSLFRQMRSEIGVSDGIDDDSPKAPRRPDKPPSKAKVPRMSMKELFSLVKSPVKFLKALLSIITSLGKVVWVTAVVIVSIVLAWLVFNVPAAMNHGGVNGQNTDEGSAVVKSAVWDGDHVVLTIENKTDMMAHVAGKAEVRTWSPSGSPMSWIAPRVTALCTIQQVDVDPGATKDAQAKCDGKPTGVWPRVKAVLEYQ